MSRFSLRTPSPSMAVALSALFISFGGTGYAATQLDHGPTATVAKKKAKHPPSDAVTDTKLFNSLIPHAHVAFAAIAGSAGSAGSAATAGHASTADTATNAAHADTASQASSLPALTWTNLTLENGAIVYGGGSYGAPSFTKDAEGFVHLSGAVDGASATGAFATLPSGFRPTRAKNMWLRAAATNGSADPHLVDVYISSNSGEMFLEKGEGATATFVDLEGITFYAG